MQIIFRKKIYNSLPDLQIDIDHWLRSYNYTRPHSGKHCYGKTGSVRQTVSNHIFNTTEFSICEEGRYQVER
ncbi:MAG: hypothetical protein sGL2_05700 [Candidatus Mesenet longicola]|nr:MAG: hypothetical protein sGL2_05700 [Candidatus Mesenet longicola]